jgi:adenosine deaminase
VGVNTDTRTISNITLSEEYEKLHKTFGWGTEDFYNCNRNALEAAFISDDVRDRLMAQLVEGYQVTL